MTFASLGQLLAEYGMTDDEAAEHERRNGPWTCSACDHRNEAFTASCRSCGEDRPGTAADDDEIPDRVIPYPVGMRIDQPDGLSFQCPCDPESDEPDTYISFVANVLEGYESCTCGGCGRTYVYKAHITEVLEIEGDDWQVQL